MDKRKYRGDLKKIANEALENLEPVVKKTVNQIIDITKELAEEVITSSMDQLKNLKRKKVNNGKHLKLLENKKESKGDSNGK